MCALLVPQFAMQRAGIRARVCCAPPGRVAAQAHFGLLSGAQEPCLLRYFFSAGGDDNHLRVSASEEQMTAKTPLCS